VIPVKPVRIHAVTFRIFTDIRNDPRTLALIFIAPLLAMFLFGLAFSGKIRDVRTIVVNNDRGFTIPFSGKRISISGEIIDRLDRKALDIEFMDDFDAALRKARSGNVYVLIYFPETFTRGIAMKRINPNYKSVQPVKVMLDRSNTTIADAALQSIATSLNNAMKESKYAVPLTMDTKDELFASDAQFMDFFIPGIMSFVVYLLTTLLTLLSFVNERTTGTLERITATPLTVGEIVTGYCIAFSIIGMLQSGILLAVGILVFNIMIVGNVALAFLVVAMLAVACQAMGILLSSFANRELQAIQLFPIVALPALLLGGVFWPVEAIPAWLRPVSKFLPITYAIDSCRSVFLRGWDFSMISNNLLILGVFGLVFLFLAVLTLRWKR
jgi:ABC-2 type transport system permease protein